MPTSTEAPAPQPAGADWPAWSVDGDPAALARYVLPDAVGQHVPVPGPSKESRLTRLRRVYELLAERGVGYAYEAPGSGPAGQLIRSPHEVLWAPRHATCLDLAVVLAGGCVKAGLAVAVVLVEPTAGGGPRHALVAVRLMDTDGAGEWPDAGDDGCWLAPPAGFLDGINTAPDGPRDLVVVDPNGLARSLGTSPARGLAASFAAAVAAGAGYLTGPGWAWQVGVPIRAHPTPYRPTDRPTVEPLREPYRDPGSAEGPLRLLRAEYQVVPFQARDELKVLTGFCREIAAGQRIGRPTGLAVVHGVGGSGKTRLALELAERLRAEGWYAGALREDAGEIGWLASVVSPALIVVDYADARGTETQRLLQALKDKVGSPAVVLLTARSVQDTGPTGPQPAPWLAAITNGLTTDMHPYAPEILGLPDEHPRSGNIFRSTYAALADATSVPPPLPDPAPGVRWTTLDLVLLGWLAARGVGDLPTTPAALYDEVLVHERKYWNDVYESITGEPEPPTDLLTKAAVCVSLLAPTAEQADAALMAVEDLSGDARWRDQVRRTLVKCLSPGPGERLALRPDPVGDHLLLTVLGGDRELFDRCLAGVQEEAYSSALVVLNRAGQHGTARAADLIASAVRAHPSRWPVAVAVGYLLGGPARRALEDLARTADTPLPLAEVSQQIPFYGTGLFRLGLLLDERRLAEARAQPTDRQALAALLLRVSHRRGDAGDRAGALGAITEAVGHYRALTDADPVAYRPGLAMSLNNLSNRQAGAGDRVGALGAITEAVGHYRALADADPVAYRPGLAMSLNNLGGCQAEAGDRVGALGAITEAVGHYRALAEANPAAYLPDLAMSLNNLGGCQAKMRDRVGALGAITEAVGHYRALAEANRAVYLPGLAMSLNNLSARQIKIGDRAAALGSAIEALGYYRALAEANRAVYRPGLAMSLNNLSRLQAESGDQAQALGSVTEAVGHYRVLAEVNSVTYLDGLAGSLNNLSNLQAGNGDRIEALCSIAEAVTLRRTLVEANPAYLPGLAMSLNSLAVQQAGNGDRVGALGSVTEAVGHYRALVEADPAVYLPDLAMSLNTLAARQAGNGDCVGALGSVTEAVGHYRALVEADPAVYLPDLAMSLNTLAVQQAGNGDCVGALGSVTEAVTIRRALVEADPAAYLPDLAMSLNNLAVQQAGIGDCVGALGSVTEAVTIRRALVEANPAAYLPDLARSLNNLSNMQAGIGDCVGALGSVTEAVTIRRILVEANPGAYLPDLAMSLHNLSVQQAESGDRVEALSSITEAVSIRRTLAEVNLAAYRPDLAISLNNLSNAQAAVGDWAAALGAITEAVGHYRALAEVNPAAFLPDLAMSLNNLSSAQARAGDRAGALGMITEAVRHYRSLVEATSAAYLPNLATSLNNLSDRLVEAGRAEDAAAAWDAPLQAMPDQISRAELRAHAASWLANNDQPGPARRQLTLATQEADDATAAPYLLTRARHTIRRVAQATAADDPQLPAWATADLPDPDVQLANTWASASGWPQREHLAREHATAFTSPPLRRTIAVLSALYPGDPSLADLTALLANIDEYGLEVALRERRQHHARRTLVQDWIATRTSTWAESQAFFRDHQAELTSQPVTELLASIDDDVAQQHWAILTLTRDLAAEQVFAIAADPSAAEDHAITALEHADLPRLAAILTASPQILGIPTTGALLLAVLALANGQIDDARQLTEHAARDAAPTTRRAHALRLRDLATQRPDLAAGQLAEIMNPSPEST